MIFPQHIGNVHQDFSEARDESPQEIYLNDERLYFLLASQLLYSQDSLYPVWIDPDPFLRNDVPQQLSFF